MSHWIQHFRDNSNAAYLIYLLLLLILIADSQTQLGFAHGVLYAPLLLLASLLNQPQVLNVSFVLAVAAVVLGYWLSPAAPAGFASVYVLANRAGAVICLLLIYLQTRSAMQLQQRESATRDNLTQQQQQLELASQLARFGCWYLDTHSKMITLSPQAAKLLAGNTDTQLTVSQFCQLFHPDYRSALQQALTACQEQYTAFDIECPCLPNESPPCWLRIIGHCCADDNALLQGVLQDSNAVHQSEMRLIQAQQRFQQWADSMPIVVWTAASDGQLTFVSQLMTTFSGMPTEELLLNWLDIVHPEDRERVMSHWQHCLRTGDPYNIEFRFRRLDGQYIWHLTRAVAVYDNYGQIEKWLGSAMALGAAAKPGQGR
ncbi:PAS domain-containing protein [Rheinheimera nanhaiensis]|nr:PAS domain-containing protein [Rheinheimera nanhaiensis]